MHREEHGRLREAHTNKRGASALPRWTSAVNGAYMAMRSGRSSACATSSRGAQVAKAADQANTSDAGARVHASCWRRAGVLRRAVDPGGP